MCQVAVVKPRPVTYPAYSSRYTTCHACHAKCYSVDWLSPLSVTSDRVQCCIRRMEAGLSSSCSLGYNDEHMYTNTLHRSNTLLLLASLPSPHITAIGIGGILIGGILAMVLSVWPTILSMVPGAYGYCVHHVGMGASAAYAACGLEATGYRIGIRDLGLGIRD